MEVLLHELRASAVAIERRMSGVFMDALRLEKGDRNGQHKDEGEIARNLPVGRRMVPSWDRTSEQACISEF